MTRLRATLVRTVPRAAILITAVAEMARGDVLYGSFCLVALAITLAPAIHTRRIDAGIPVEIELALLWLMIADMTLGNWLGLYSRVTWFDKALHLSNSALVGVIGFLAVYVLHLTGRTRFHPLLDAVAILLITLGIGAIWELSEYGVDRLFGRATQGSPGFSALDDTMLDLVADGIGGLIGAAVGSQYIRLSKRSRRRVESFAQMVAQREHVPERAGSASTTGPAAAGA